MTPAELGVAGGIGVIGLALVGLGYLVRRRRRRAATDVAGEVHAARRARAEADEDPILAALGVSDRTSGDRP